MQQKNSELEDSQRQLKQQLRDLLIEQSSTAVDLETEALSDSKIKRKYKDLNREHQALQMKYEEHDFHVGELQQKIQQQTAAHGQLQEQAGDLKKTLSQVHTCVEHAINQCDSVRQDSGQTVQELRSQVSKVVASLKPAAARATMRLRRLGEEHDTRVGSERSPQRPRYGSPTQPPPARRLVVSDVRSPTERWLPRHGIAPTNRSPTEGSFTTSPNTSSPLGRRSPAQRRLRRSPDRAQLIEFAVRGGAKKAPLGITFGFREGTSHGLLEIQEILPDTPAARRGGKSTRAFHRGLPR